MNHDLLSESEALSALADGALQGEAFARAVERLGRDEAARSQWHAYHVIGDVLRSSELARGAADGGFVDRLQARLAAEPPLALAQAEAVELTPAVPPMPAREAANHDAFRWKMVAGFASLAAVAAIGWNSFATLEAAAPPAGATLAQAAPGAAVVAQQDNAGVGGGGQVPSFVMTGNDAAPQVMLRNPRLDEFLAAHNQAVGGATLQTAPGFVRNASFEGRAR
ncbi:sigma-E factor negative regulatory protein [Xylophilus sp. ASV27]|uniref:sigma-E factor negative regulatory protein n=1 Tax=Xylophilus sp. ASV27 TaxID=2795129 RepID=UPI0018EACE1C|nr:sigma-E factor negative regulatory protein [Xylophilus sp. ASV27]